MDSVILRFQSFHYSFYHSITVSIIHLFSHVVVFIFVLLLELSWLRRLYEWLMVGGLEE
jgi:hypothetical protein